MCICNLILTTIKLSLNIDFSFIIFLQNLPYYATSTIKSFYHLYCFMNTVYSNTGLQPLMNAIKIMKKVKNLLILYTFSTL